MIRICNSFAQHSEATLLPAIGYVEKAVQRYYFFLNYSTLRPSFFLINAFFILLWVKSRYFPRKKLSLQIDTLPL